MSTHINKDGFPRMVNISDKVGTTREAQAQSKIQLSQRILDAFDQHEVHSPKGPVFQTAIVAGIMAAKKTHELIPMCHQIPISSIDVSCKIEKNILIIISTVVADYKTGVEMEALTASSIAALTVYDMCKSIDNEMVIQETKLLFKKGGKSDR